MSNTRQKIEDAKWLLERMLNWIATADVKTGIVVTLQIAMFGGLATAYGAAEEANRSEAAYFFISLTCGSLLSAIYCAAIAALPRISGPSGSNIYFGQIAKKTAFEFNHSFELIDNESFLADLTTQIHRNAEISLLKHVWVRSSLEWTFCAALPWCGSIFLLIMR